MEKILKQKKYAYLLSIFCMFLWGSAFPVVKLTNLELNINSNDIFAIIYIAGIRFFLAGVFLFIFISIKSRKELKLLKHNFLYLFELGLLVITFGYFFFYIGTANTTGMKSALFTSSSTFLVVIFSHFLLKDERFNNTKLIAIILGLSGVIISNIDKGFEFSFTILGEGFMLINAILGALGTIFVKKYGNSIPSFIQSCGQFLYGGLLLLLIGYIGNSKNIDFTLTSLILISYGAIISSLAFSLWYYILKYYEASKISFLRLFIPFFGTFLSAIFLGEKISFSIIIGLLLIIIGIIIINKKN